MRVNALLHKINAEIAYLEYSNFYEDMSKVNDINYFSQIFESKDRDEKQKIEEGIIYLSTLAEKGELKDYEAIF